MNISKVVITGGPCAGKTSALAWIQNHFTRMGWRVLFVPETATELIKGGVAPWTCGSNLDYQKCQVWLQMEKEKVFETAAKSMNDDKILIVCDRGLMDNKAYMTEEEFDVCCESIGCSYVEARDHYDAVFHLVTAANGAPEFYSSENNAARYETVAEAVELDNRLISAWTGHPHLRVIDNSTDFENKLKRLINEMIAFLGEPEPIEYERKFLIEKPDTAWLEANPYCRRLDITQVYLKTIDETERRIRRRGEKGRYMYYQTVKRSITSAKRVEVERRITQRQYNELLTLADPECNPVTKKRYCLMHDKQYFEIDIYPFWEDCAILEIESSGENVEIRFPENIHVIKEVTDDASYKTHSLAKINWK